MKWRGKIAFVILALALVAVFAPSPAMAADPAKDYQYALSACTGFTVAEIQAYQQKFDSDYGWDHQLTTPAQWEGSYIARANEFAVTLGCQPVIGSDNQVTFWVKIYRKWFAFYNGAQPTPD